MADVDLVFQRVKVGKKPGINFDRFEEGLRKMALQKQMPYYSLVKCAV